MAVPALIAADDQMSEGASVSDTVARVEQWFKRLGLADELRLVPIGDAGQFYTVALRTKQNTAEAQLPDVGFGISQVLPIIVQSYLAPKRAVILLEQPEIHLHPAVQAELADFLIEVSRDRNLQFIIESHSEHFLRRLQQRVAEAQLSEHEVRIYFCERNAEGSMATSLQMDEFGQIPNWPKDFFGPVEEDLEKMVMARIARRKANDAESDRH
jgi:predicted ATPase